MSATRKSRQIQRKVRAVISKVVLYRCNKNVIRIFIASLIERCQRSCAFVLLFEESFLYDSHMILPILRSIKFLFRGCLFSFYDVQLIDQKCITYRLVFIIRIKGSAQNFYCNGIFQSIQLKVVLFISACKTYKRRSRHNVDIRIFSHRNKSMTNRFSWRVE